MPDKTLDQALDGIQNERIARAERKIFDLETGNKGAATGSTSQPASIEKARVIAVDIRNFTVDVRTEKSQKLFTDRPFMSMYCNQAQGEGMNFMPEVGSTCWVCIPGGDAQTAFILGWMMASETGSYRGGRVLLNPGDIHLSSRDGNFVIIRRGGVLQLGATAICQTVYIPLKNALRNYAENYEVHTPGGDLTWLVDREDTNGEGHKETTFTLAAKEFADDPNDKPIAVLKMGSHKGSAATILSLETAQGKTSLKIEKTGEVSWEMQKLSLTVKGDFKLDVDGPTTATLKAGATVAVTGALAVSADSLAMSAGGGAIGIAGGVPTLDGAQIKLGDGTLPAVLNSPELAAWVQSVTLNLNTIIAALTPGLAPSTPVPGLAPVSDPGSNHVAQKVKAS